MQMAALRLATERDENLVDPLPVVVAARLSVVVMTFDEERNSQLFDISEKAVLIFEGSAAGYLDAADTSVRAT